jgi:hypothetical protein
MWQRHDSTHKKKEKKPGEEEKKIKKMKEAKTHK